MKLGINGWRVHGQRTGVGRYVLNVVRHWTPELVRGFSEITFYVPRPLDRAAIPIPENIRVQVLASDLPMLAWENTRLAASSSDDLLFCPSFSRPLICRGRTVVATHDAVHAVHPELFPWSVRVFYRRLYAWSSRHAALVVTNTEAARQDIAAYCKVPLARIRVVYLAPAECFRPCGDAEEVEEGRKRVVGSDAPFFLFVGKMSGRRYLPALLEAFALFKKSTTHTHVLLLVGLNPLDLNVPELCARLGIAESVRLCGYVPDADLNLLYNAAEAFVMPSVYETSSLPIMEAQAAGAPVVCIDTPGMREITGGAAAMIPRLAARGLMEAMLRMVDDRAFRAGVATGALENSKRFSWRRCSKETFDVLAEAAAGA